MVGKLLRKVKSNSITMLCHIRLPSAKYTAVMALPDKEREEGHSCILGRSRYGAQRSYLRLCDFSKSLCMCLVWIWYGAYEWCVSVECGVVCRNKLSPYTMWDPWMKLRLLKLRENLLYMVGLFTKSQGPELNSQGNEESFC